MCSAVLNENKAPATIEPMMFLRFTADYPKQVVGPDERLYGPFGLGDVACIPCVMARIFVESGTAETTPDLARLTLFDIITRQNPAPSAGEAAKIFMEECAVKGTVLTEPYVRSELLALLKTKIKESGGETAFLTKYPMLLNFDALKHLHDPGEYYIQGQHGPAFVAKRLADALMADYPFRTLNGSDEIYWYHPSGVYKRNGKNHIKAQCVNRLRDRFSTRSMNETISYIQGSTFIDPAEIDSGWINVKNGLLNPLTGEFRDHTPGIFSTAQLPIVYDPKATCPTWLGCLADKVDTRTSDVLQEFFGYCYLPGQKFEKAMLLYGPKRTFKSTALLVIENMLGTENITAYSLQFLNEDKFAGAYLYGRIANIHAELSAAGLSNTSFFMPWVGGDRVSYAPKGGHPLHFFPSTKLIFACNVIPQTPNKDPAFYRRWLLLHFGRQTPEDKVDPSMRQKLLGELPGILNWSLEGLKRLLANGKFSYWLTDEEVKKIYERESDSISSFILDRVDTDDEGGRVTKREMYRSYGLFCQANHFRLENVVKFGKAFKELTGCGTGRVGSDSIPAYTGVRMRGDATPQGKLTEFGQEEPEDEEF